VKQYLGKALYPEFAKDAPFMIDHYQDYWLGKFHHQRTTRHARQHRMKGLME